MRRITLCVAVAAMLCALGAAYAQDGESWADRVSVQGYFHGRYDFGDTCRSGQPVDDSFNFRRMFLTLIASPNDQTTGIITLARCGPGDPNIDLYHAYVDYKLSDDWNVQVGQVGTWFGLEGWESSSARLPLERALVTEGGPGFYFAGASDRGVWFRRNPDPAKPSEPLVVLGVCNGEFRAADTNSNKTLSVDLKWKRDWGLYGASWMNGKFTGSAAGAVETNRSAWDAYVRVLPAPWGAEAEYASGELMGCDIDGYYVQGMYAFPDVDGTLFARWEEFSRDSCAAAAAYPAADYEAWLIGYSHRLDESNELTIQWTDGEWTMPAAASGTDTAQACGSCPGGGGWGAIQWEWAFR